jgi:Lrp/AsnC family transcriptional regulator for asnA, asnC and gidA
MRVTEATADRAARRSGVRRPAGNGRDRDEPIDELDRKIIQQLQVNARIPNTEIARALNVTETTIRNRVSRLLDEELIEIVAVVMPKAHQSTLSTFIALTFEPAHVDAAIADLRDRQEVRWLSRMLAPAQVLTEVFYPDHDALVRFQTEYLAHLPGITRIDSWIVLSAEKASFEWEI